MITTKEIAKICSVSVATVNRALHDRPDINPKTKEMILNIAAEHGYRPHLMARSLAKGKSMLIGVAIFDIRNPFFPQLIDTIQTELKKLGLFMHLGITNNSIHEEIECLDMMAGMKVDGIIVLPLNQGPDFEDFLEKLHVPVVTMCNRVSEHYTFIGAREKDAVKDAAKFLLKRNYERLIYVSPPLRYTGKRNIYTINERLAGFQEAISQSVVRPDTCVVREKNYLERIEQLLSTGRSRTAFLCSSDTYALNVLTFLREKGYKIPEEIGIMGFDNIDFLKYITPPLATVSYPIERIGEEAVKSLARLLQGEQPPQEILFDTEIISGNSI
ncbi:MAG: LacI family transcriptional regulator [bacterium]|nr:LacI family transcriptional regulator [bacterium]